MAVLTGDRVGMAIVVENNNKLVSRAIEMRADSRESD